MHYLISWGLLSNILLAAKTHRTSLFFSELLQIISFSAMGALGMQGCTLTLCRQRRPSLCLLPRHLRTFSILSPREHPPKRWQSLGLYGTHTSESDQKQIPLLVGQAHHETFFCSTAFLANMVEKAEDEKRAASGDSTHKYEWGAWEKAAVCHHTFFYLLLRRKQRAKFLVVPVWLITGANFDFLVKIKVSEMPV